MVNIFTTYYVEANQFDTEISNELFQPQETKEKNIKRGQDEETEERRLHEREQHEK